MWGFRGGWGCCGGGLGFGWWGILNLVFGVILLAMVVIAVIWFVRRLLAGNRRPWSTGTSLATPEAILKERYARGEITREEYLSMLRDIEGGMHR